MLDTSSTQEKHRGHSGHGVAAGGISERTLAGVQPQRVVAKDNLGHAQSLLVIDFNADGVIDTRDVLNLGGNRGQTDEQDAQALNANADLQRNNVQWLDANSDGVLDARDPAFAAVKLYLDINGDARVQGGEARSLAQAGITVIDFTHGEIRYADGHTDALTAQTLTGETSGVKLTKVYEMVDGQHVDLHAGDVLESEGYQGQDASGAIRQQTFEQEAVRTGDWEGTAEQEIKTDLLDGGLYLFRKDVCLDLATSANDFAWRKTA